MKRITEEHFNRMEMMCRYFESKSKQDKLFLSKYEVSKKINARLN